MCKDMHMAVSDKDLEEMITRYMYKYMHVCMEFSLTHVIYTGSGFDTASIHEIALLLFIFFTLQM